MSKKFETGTADLRGSDREAALTLRADLICSVSTTAVLKKAENQKYFLVDCVNSSPRHQFAKPKGKKLADKKKAKNNDDKHTHDATREEREAAQPNTRSLLLE